MVIYLILKILLWNQAWVVLFILYIPDEGNESQETSLNSLSVTVYPYIFFSKSHLSIIPLLSLTSSFILPDPIACIIH